MIQRKMTYLERVPRRLHERLENWGRYFKPKARGKPSVVHDVCEGVAGAAGKRSYQDSYGPSERAPYRDPVDTEDAMIIEWAWRKCDHRVKPEQRALLRAYYVEAADPRIVCRLLQIRWPSYDDELYAAAEAFGVALAILECVDIDDMSGACISPSAAR